VNSQDLFGDQDFLLIKPLEKRLLQLGDEPGAPLPPEVEHGHDHNLIQIESARSLPNASQRELSLLGREASEAIDEPSLHVIE
jgi:hypothetical protein